MENKNQETIVEHMEKEEELNLIKITLNIAYCGG